LECSYILFINYKDVDFPFDPPLTGNPTIDDKKLAFHKFLRYIYIHGRHPSILTDPDLIDFSIFNVSSDESKIESTRKKYESQCPTICQQLQNGANELNMMMGLAIGSENNNVPFLQYLCDIYQRDRMQLSLTQSKPIDVNYWCTESHFLEQIKTRYKDNGEKIVAMIKHSLSSYLKRIQPEFVLTQFSKIVDDIFEIARYFQSAVQFLNYVLRQSAINDDANIPFQWDFSIAVKSTKTVSNVVKVDFGDDSGDDDEEDDQDEDETKDDYFDCIGSVKEKITKNKLVHNHAKIDRQEETTGEVRNVTRIFSDAYKTFKEQMDTEIDNYPRLNRFQAFLDRRSQFTTYDGAPPKINMRTNYRSVEDKDEIIFFTPPKNARSIPEDHVPEVYFNHIRQILIPNNDYVDEKISVEDGASKTFNDKGNINIDRSDNYLRTVKLLEHITSHTPCNSAMLTFSFQVEQEDEIKCYLWFGGKCIRFVPSDIIDILPMLFDLDYKKNAAFTKELRDARSIVTTTQYEDVQFNHFFKKASILKNPEENLTKYRMTLDELNSEADNQQKV